MAEKKTQILGSIPRSAKNSRAVKRAYAPVDDKIRKLRQMEKTCRAELAE